MTIIPPKMAYSYSRLNAFKCRRRFKKLYIEKLKEPTTLPAEAGGLVHDVMKIYLNWLYKEEIPADLNYLREAIKHVQTTRDHDPKAFDSAKDTLQNVETFRIDPKPRQFWIEQKLAFNDQWILLNDWFDPETYFRAIIDWTYIPADQKTLFIIDHKSGWNDPDPDQLPIYAICGFLALKETGLVDRIEIKWNMIAKDRIIEGGYFTPDDLPAEIQKVDAQIREIELNEDWSPTAGHYCSYCGFREDCPALEKGMKDLMVLPGVEVETMAQAEKLLEVLILAGERLKDLEKLLKKFVTDKGPVKALGKILEARTSEKWTEEDNFAIQKKLKGIGIHPIDVVNDFGFTETKLKNLLKKHGKSIFLNEILGRYGKTTAETNEPKIYVDKGDKK